MLMDWVVIIFPKTDLNIWNLLKVLEFVGALELIIFF